MELERGAAFRELPLGSTLWFRYWLTRRIISVPLSRCTLPPCELIMEAFAEEAKGRPDDEE